MAGNLAGVRRAVKRVGTVFAILTAIFDPAQGGEGKGRGGEREAPKGPLPRLLPPSTPTSYCPEREPRRVPELVVLRALQPFSVDKLGGFCGRIGGKSEVKMDGVWATEVAAPATPGEVPYPPQPPEVFGWDFLPPVSLKAEVKSPAGDMFARVGVRGLVDTGCGLQRFLLSNRSTSRSNNDRKALRTSCRQEPEGGVSSGGVQFVEELVIRPQS